MKKVIIFLLLFFLHAQNINIAQNSNNLNIPVEHYKCGIDVKEFEHSGLLKPLNVLNFDFQCPAPGKLLKNYNLSKETLQRIKYLISKKQDYNVILSNVDFISGKYTCSYNFGDSFSFSVSLQNTSCSKNQKTLEQDYIKEAKKLKKIQTPVPKFQELANYKLEEPIDLYSIYNEIYMKLTNTINYFYETVKNNKGFVDLNSLNSHTEYEKTLPAILISLFTLDDSILKKDILTPDGQLNLKQSFIANLFTLNQNKLYDNSDTNDFYNFIKDKTTKAFNLFWGFYYYLMINLSQGFSDLIKIIFAGGTLLLFGGIAIAKKTDFVGIEKTQGLQFDFPKKFLHIGVVFLLFTAPVIISTAPKNLSSQYLYGGKENAETNNAITLMQVFMRYMWQLGNYFANDINDRGSFAYLNYVKSSIGLTSTPEDLIKEANYKYVNYAINIYDIYNSYNFAINYCALSYPKIYKKFSYFPKNIDVNYFEINAGYTKTARDYLFKNFGFNQVSYSFCANLYKKVNNFAFILLSEIKAYKPIMLQKSSNLKQTTNVMIRNYNDFIKTYISYNNKMGWFTVIALPAVDKILESKNIILSINIFTDTNFNKFIEKNQNQMLKYQAIGSSEKNNLTQKEPNFIETIASFINRYWNEGIDQLGNIQNGGIYKISYFFSYWSSKVTSFTILPGFSSLYNTIKDFLSSKDNESKKQNPINNFFKKIFAKISPLSKIVNFLGDIPVVAISLIISIIIYYLLITTVVLMLISIAIVMKTIFYFLEILMTFIVSYAIVLWSLMINSQQANQSIGNFIFHTIKLAFIPLMIIFSVYFLIIANKLLDMLYELFILIISNVSKESVYLTKNKYIDTTSILDFFNSLIGSVFSSVTSGLTDFSSGFALGGLTGSAFLVILIIKLIMDIYIIMKFDSIAFEIFGKKVETFMGANEKVFDRSSSKFGGGMI